MILRKRLAACLAAVLLVLPSAAALAGELSYATVGPATTQHIAGEALRRAAGLNLTYVPYPGGAPAVNALLGGHVSAVLTNYSEVMEQVNAGKLRALAVTTSERIPPLPKVPTLAEAGHKDLEATAGGLIQADRTRTLSGRRMRTRLRGPRPQAA